MNNNNNKEFDKKKKKTKKGKRTNACSTPNVMHIPYFSLCLYIRDMGPGGHKNFSFA